MTAAHRSRRTLDSVAVRADDHDTARQWIEDLERFAESTGSQWAAAVAAPWTERATQELRASGETAQRRDPSKVAALTAQELQVSRFVAEGLFNREIAGQLFLSPRTIAVMT